ncbi:MAG: KH domain-containing protein, partial [Acidimicrobiales bacterium]
MEVDVPLEDQAGLARDFLEGLLNQFELSAEVQSEELDEDTLEVRVTGDDLGLLIGPKGSTLGAIQDLTRTVVQRKSGGRTARLLVDVGGYRQKRKVA